MRPQTHAQCKPSPPPHPHPPVPRNPNCKQEDTAALSRGWMGGVSRVHALGPGTRLWPQHDRHRRGVAVGKERRKAQRHGRKHVEERAWAQGGGGEGLSAHGEGLSAHSGFGFFLGLGGLAC